jgi:signal transduction histidine kinase
VDYRIEVRSKQNQRVVHADEPDKGLHESGRVAPAAPSGPFGGRGTALAVVALTVGMVAWALANLSAGGEGFAILVSDKLMGSEEAASAVARLFAALVLGLFLVEEVGWRARWVACGLAVLGLGHLIFGYLEPLIQDDPPELNESLYEVFVTQTFACALFAIGLFPQSLPRFLVRAATIIPASLLAGYEILFEFLHAEEWMPALALVEDPEKTVRLGTPFGWLTPWHWVIFTLPLGLAMTAVAGAFWQSRRGLLRGWLLFAMVLLGGSLLHEYVWPSAYGGRVLTSADALSLMFAVVVCVGGVAELRRVARERAALLASERDRARRLDELNVLRADFSAMVAHELDGPIAAIRKLNEMMSAEGSDAAIRGYATTTVEGELDALSVLVRDVRAAAAVERGDFEVETHPLPLKEILADAEGYARTLPGDHPVKSRLEDGLDPAERVLADPKRISQVLRNLLSNAAKYSADGAPVEINARREGGRIRIEVADSGPGIHPDELARIFEKFGRGRDYRGRKVSGVGLGLYLSRRIVRSHGSELRVRTQPGAGSVFGFDLEVVR